MQEDIRTVEVQAGSMVTVDFTRPKTEGAFAPNGSKIDQVPIPDPAKPDKVPEPSSNGNTPPNGNTPTPNNNNPSPPK
jgi:hypothetical protein